MKPECEGGGDNDTVLRSRVSGPNCRRSKVNRKGPKSGASAAVKTHLEKFAEREEAALNSLSLSGSTDRVIKMRNAGRRAERLVARRGPDLK